MVIYPCCAVTLPQLCQNYLYYVLESGNWVRLEWLQTLESIHLVADCDT